MQHMVGAVQRALAAKPKALVHRGAFETIIT